MADINIFTPTHLKITKEKSKNNEGISMLTVPFYRTIVTDKMNSLNRTK